MFLLDSEEALVAAFRPVDRRAIPLPPGPFPLFVRDYLVWRDGSGARVYLVFSGARGQVTGIAFQRGPAGGEPVAAMCELCHAMGTSDRVGLLTADRNDKERVGLCACLDLRCDDRIEDDANRRGTSALEAKARVLERMVRFAREALGIDLAAPAHA